QMRHDIAVSMIEHDFYAGHLELVTPDPDNLPARFVGMEYLQVGEPPFYYILASLPLRLLQSQNITFQLYGVRLFSLVLYLISILAGWGLVAELCSCDRSLRLLVPLTMAMLPAYTDSMTAVNSDVGAAAMFSLFLWGSVHIMRRGVTIPRLAWVLIAAALCYLTKPTAYLAVPLSVMVLLFAFWRGKWRRLAWGLMVFTSVALVITAFSWGDAAFWYRSTVPDEPTRIASTDTPLGEYALRLDLRTSSTPGWVRQMYQPLPSDVVANLQGQSVTYGVWIWADEPAEIRSPSLNFGYQSVSEDISVGNTPQFYAFTADVPEDAWRMWITLSPFHETKDLTVFYDGFVLTRGEFSSNQPPAYSDQNAQQGEWDNKPFQNLLRNASAEQAWPSIRPYLDKLGANLLPDNMRPSMLLYSLFDWRAAGWYYQLTSKVMLRTFWAQFGWGHVSLIGHKPYRILAGITLLGLLGAGWYLWEYRRHLPKAELLLLGLVVLSIWGGGMTRGMIYIFLPHVWIPGARYTYPSIVPVILTLAAGWLMVLRLIEQWLRLPAFYSYVVYLLGFVILDAYALFSITRYYGG
ncbi:MAG: hypothetical protein KJ732_08260, partial [Candidatus Margulisbacteria bacterium]|nr:hypothetical protein [Candidatus Margulisiibacteriota bacterium]